MYQTGKISREVHEETPYTRDYRVPDPKNQPWGTRTPSIKPVHVDRVRAFFMGVGSDKRKTGFAGV